MCGVYFDRRGGVGQRLQVLLAPRTPDKKPKKTKKRTPPRPPSTKKTQKKKKKKTSKAQEDEEDSEDSEEEEEEERPVPKKKLLVIPTATATAAGGKPKEAQQIASSVQRTIMLTRAAAAAAAATTTTTTTTTTEKNKKGGETPAASSTSASFVSSASLQATDSGGVFAQVKLDGDRLQAHVRSGGVQLFTRNGFDVSALYSDVRDALQQSAAQWAPCILDGELIVVDAAGVPIPWDNEKWRYNGSNSNSSSKPLSEWAALVRADPTVQERTQVLALEYAAEEVHAGGGTCWEEASEALGREAVTFLPIASAGRWGGAAQRGEQRARALHTEGCRLRYVVFDLLMCRGEELSGMGYAVRFERLEAEMMPLMQNKMVVATVELIQGTQRISTAAALVDLLREAVRDRWEGYVLKDPDAPYAFERSASVQKVKLSGPDVNTGVIGLGFSLSTHPRRWGILTALSGGEVQQERMADHYCRTEVLEGDALHRAFETVYALRSRVAVQDLGAALKRVDGTVWREAAPEVAEEEERTDSSSSSSSKRRHRQRVLREGLVELDAFIVGVSEVELEEEEEEAAGQTAVWVRRSTRRVVEVRWRAKASKASSSSSSSSSAAAAAASLLRGHNDDSDFNGTVRVPLAVLSASSDVQWLCSPWECPFALSLRGDLRPLEGNVLRHPVGRPELVGMQASPTWDTPASVQRKFDDACAIETCVEMHVLRRMARLRALPATRRRLEEIGRTVTAWLASTAPPDSKDVGADAAGAAEADGGTAAGGQKRKRAATAGEGWPQLPPGGFTTINGLSQLIEGAQDTLCARLPALGAVRATGGKGAATLRAALRRLGPEERQAMADLPPRSQWAPLRLLQRTRQRQRQRLRDEAEVQSAASDEAEVRADLALRLEGLKAALGKGLVLLPHECASVARCGASLNAPSLVVALLPLILKHAARPRLRPTDPKADDNDDDDDDAEDCCYDAFEGHTCCSGSEEEEEWEEEEEEARHHQHHHHHPTHASLLREWDREEEEEEEE
jgi:ATP-dependent DNA ligase